MMEEMLEHVKQLKQMMDTRPAVADNTVAQAAISAGEAVADAAASILTMEQHVTASAECSVTAADGSVTTEATPHPHQQEDEEEDAEIFLDAAAVPVSGSTVSASTVIDIDTEEHTEKPQVNTEQPQANTEQPQANTEQPQANTEHPQTNTEQPQANTEQQSGQWSSTHHFETSHSSSFPCFNAGVQYCSPVFTAGQTAPVFFSSGCGSRSSSSPPTMTPNQSASAHSAYAGVHNGAHNAAHAGVHNGAYVGAHNAAHAGVHNGAYVGAHNAAHGGVNSAMHNGAHGGAHHGAPAGPPYCRTGSAIPMPYPPNYPYPPHMGYFYGSHPGMAPPPYPGFNDIHAPRTAGMYPAPPAFNASNSSPDLSNQTKINGPIPAPAPLSGNVSDVGAVGSLPPPLLPEKTDSARHAAVLSTIGAAAATAIQSLGSTTTMTSTASDHHQTSSTSENMQEHSSRQTTAETPNVDDDTGSTNNAGEDAASATPDVDPLTCEDCDTQYRTNMGTGSPGFLSSMMHRWTQPFSSMIPAGPLPHHARQLRAQHQRQWRSDPRRSTFQERLRASRHMSDVAATNRAATSGRYSDPEPLFVNEPVSRAEGGGSARYYANLPSAPQEEALSDTPTEEAADEVPVDSSVAGAVEAPVAGAVEAPVAGADEAPVAGAHGAAAAQPPSTEDLAPEQ